LIDIIRLSGVRTWAVRVGIISRRRI